MDTAVVFKRKARELVVKLQDRFPGRLMLATLALDQTDDAQMLMEYIDRIHRPYGTKIKDRDENFFMTTSDIDDPMQMATMLRSLWMDMSESDRQCVWRYFDLFEKLAEKFTGETRRRA